MKNLFTFAAFLAFMTFLLIVMVEWASGCGQVWVDSQGIEHLGQCWIVK